MSSRSKERISAVLKKLFRSPVAKKNNGSSKDSNNSPHTVNNVEEKVEKQQQAGSVVVAQNGTIAKTTSSTSSSCSTSSSTGSSNNISNNNGIVPVTGSPGKRLRCAISPSPEMGILMQKPVDTTIRSRRLMKEFKEIQRSQHSKVTPAFTVELINDNLYEWYARLYHIDPDSPLAEDLVELEIEHILLHIVFPDNFPFAPPFMRVVEPRIEKGFVMEGGAICMELLTPRGWASAYTVEALLMQFAASLVKGQGRVSRKVKGNKDFSKRSAEEAFRSLVKTHDKYGWVTPSLSDG